VAAAAPDGALRFGPDGAMYIAAGSSEAPSGRILRFLADGRIPGDNPDGSPLYTLVDLMPAGLDWQAASASLWTVETGRAIDRLEVRRRVGETGPVALAPQSLSSTASAPRLPRGTHASGLTIVNAASSPFDGDAIVSSIGLADLLRFDGSRTRAPAGDPVRLLNGRFGAIGGVAATPNGDIYFFTQNNETWAAGRDVLVRLRLE
jgi:glucose/arabinose dehydrogenase